MHIIIEGIDNSGKSTLALELAKRLYMPVINRIPGDDEPFENIVVYFSFAEQGYIVDRLHISEMVYGPIKRNAVCFTDKEYEMVETMLSNQNTFNIFCAGSLKDIKERCEEMKEDFITGDEIDEVHKGFLREIDKSNLDWHTYVIGDNIDMLADKIKRHFEHGG
jgi:hypothetical protein